MVSTSEVEGLGILGTVLLYVYMQFFLFIAIIFIVIIKFIFLP